MITKAVDLQAQLDLGGEVVVPDGATIYLDRTLVIRQSGTRLRGRATLVLPPGCHFDALALAGPQPEGVPTDIISDIEIEGLTFDGGFNGLQQPGGFNYFGLFAWSCDYLRVRNCTFQNWFHDGVSIGTGVHRPTGVEVSGCRFEHCRRNGLHVGSLAGGGLILRNRFVECPSQHWGPASGNGIDVEPESTLSAGTPRVSDLLIQGNVLECANTKTSVTGIGVQSTRTEPDIVNVRLVGNVASGCQTPFGMLNAFPSGPVPAIKDGLIMDNVGVFPEGMEVATACGTIYGTDGMTVTGNRFYGAPGFPHRGWDARLAVNHEFSDNLVNGQPMNVEQ